MRGSYCTILELLYCIHIEGELLYCTMLYLSFYTILEGELQYCTVLELLYCTYTLRASGVTRIERAPRPQESIPPHAPTYQQISTNQPINKYQQINLSTNINKYQQINLSTNINKSTYQQIQFSIQTNTFSNLIKSTFIYFHFWINTIGSRGCYNRI